MSEVILVNHQVKFEPGRNALSSMSAPERKFTLPSSSSRCFSVLLLHHGEVITIKNFHELVWAKNKAIVSDNTIYQNISIIRKALANVGGDKNIIETHTRRGWCVPQSVHVSIGKTQEKASIKSAVEECREPRVSNAETISNDTIHGDIKYESMLYLLGLLGVMLIMMLVLYFYVL